MCLDKHKTITLGIHKRQKMKSDYVNQVRSVYPLDDFTAQLIKAGENGNLIIIDKNKVNEQLARIGIQPSERDKIINLASDSVPQNSGGVNNKSSNTESHSIAVPFSDEFKADKREISFALDMKYFCTAKINGLPLYLINVNHCISPTHSDASRHC